MKGVLIALVDNPDSDGPLDQLDDSVHGRGRHLLLTVDVPSLSAAAAVSRSVVLLIGGWHESTRNSGVCNLYRAQIWGRNRGVVGGRDSDSDVFRTCDHNPLYAEEA